MHMLLCAHLCTLSCVNCSQSEPAGRRHTHQTPDTRQTETSQPVSAATQTLHLSTRNYACLPACLPTCPGLALHACTPLCVQFCLQSCLQTR